MNPLRLLLFLCALPLLAATNEALRLEAAARAQIGVTTVYDPAYVSLKYPGGDVPAERGVCADVVVRAFRDLGVDLQKLVHDDMKANFAAYPRNWGLKKPDPNIDHRRVPNLMKFFERRGLSVGISKQAGDYRAGDVVAWRLPGGLYHIGMVAAARSRDGQRPQIIHNIGAGAKQEDRLFDFEIIGHYRYANPADPLTRALSPRAGRGRD